MSTTLILILIGLPVGMVLLEAVQQVLDRRRYPPPGQLIDVGGYRLHWHATGSAIPGQPTIILESGRGSASYDWMLVQRELAPFARVISYDRAGYGWSEPGPAPRTSQHLADELHRLLVQAQESGPYILVAHAHGGHIVRLFARQHTTAVAGVVLVDARHETMPDLPVLGDLERANQRMRLVPLLTRMGLIRLLGKTVLPPAFREQLPNYPVTVMFQPKFFAALNQESRMTRQSDHQVRDAGHLGDLPLVVLRHGQPDLFVELKSTDAQQAESGWCAAQDKLAALSTQSTVQVAEQSGHNIMVEQPELVVAAVRQVLAEVAQRNRAPEPA